MKITAVEHLELSLLGIISFDSEKLRAKYKQKIKEAKELEKRQTEEAIKGEKLAKEHFLKQRNEELLESLNEVGKITDKSVIDTVGNCPNCGVEFHIHKDIQEPNIIDDWLDKNGSSEIAIQVEKEAKEMEKQQLKSYGEFCVAKFNGYDSVSLNDEIFEEFKKK